MFNASKVCSVLILMKFKYIYTVVCIILCSCMLPYFCIDSKRKIEVTKKRHYDHNISGHLQKAFHSKLLHGINTS